MFRFHKPIDVVTLFHAPSRPSSKRVLALLQRASAEASEGSEGTDAASQIPGASDQARTQRKDFELEVTEQPPTGDQLRSILEYVGAQRAGDLVKGARGEAEAMRRVKDSGESFVRPVVVDWNNGRAVIGDNESEILKMIRNESASI